MGNGKIVFKKMLSNNIALLVMNNEHIYMVSVLFSMECSALGVEMKIKFKSRRQCLQGL